MGRICDTALQELRFRNFLPSRATGEIRSLVANRIMAAVVNGERDPERLKSVALQAFDA